jgi:hypothetical protein
MNNLIKLLRGKKTYLVVLAACVAYGAHLLGYIDQDLFTKLLEALGIAGVAALRDAIN